MTNNPAGQAAAAKGNQLKKIIPLTLAAIVILVLVGLYCLGRASEERKQTLQDIEKGRANAQDCLQQLDELEKAKQNSDSNSTASTEREHDQTVPPSETAPTSAETSSTETSTTETSTDATNSTAQSSSSSSTTTPDNSTNYDNGPNGRNPFANSTDSR